jgi:Dihydrodipicolinate synthase/N-acetylneuraminate lyase
MNGLDKKEQKRKLELLGQYEEEGYMSKNKKLSGVIPPMMTPVDANQNIDEKGVRNIVERCIRLGVSGLFLLGTMGEGQSIVRDQRKHLVRVAVDQAGGRVPILVGVSAEGLRKVMENVKDALEAGADYLVSLAPYFFEASDQKELIVFFKNLACNISKSLVIYNNPYMTRNVLTLDTFKELSREKNIVGVKDSGGDFSFHMQLIREFGSRDDFSVFSGMEMICDAALIMGSDGVVPGIGTLIPDVFTEMYEKAKSGNKADVIGLQSKVLKIMDGIYLDGYWAWVAGQKYALSYLGLCQKHFTIDNRYLTTEEERKIQNTLSEFGIKA